MSTAPKLDSTFDIDRNVDPATRLANVMNWLATAKQNLPALSDGTLGAYRVAEASALIDRMHKVARALARRAEIPRREGGAADFRSGQSLGAQQRRAA